VPDVDLLVLGGGLAGLSLAERLAAAPGARVSAAVLEARSVYADDRTWCFWRLAPHRYEALSASSWSRVMVRDGAREAVVDCAATPYQMIPSIAFYQRAEQVIRASAQATLKLGSGVPGAPQRDGDGWRVEAEDGQVWRARYVVDTRPPSTKPESILWQSFIGDVVVADRDVFDPGVAVLMDFDDQCVDGVQFAYVLPTTPREALVETTVFGVRGLSPRQLRERHDDVLRARVGEGGVSVRRSEHGVLPMGHAPAPARAGVVHASLFHGGARASTGYAFTRVQAWADECAAALLRGAPPTAPRPDPWPRRAMDEIFLRVLRARPERGAAMLTRMFARADGAGLVRFLSDAGGIVDSLSVMRSLPPGPFLRAAWQMMKGVPCRGGA